MIISCIVSLVLSGLESQCKPMLVFTRRGVDKDHLYSSSLSGLLKLLQVGIVEPGCLHSLKASRRSRADSLTELWELRKKPGNIRTEPELGHCGLTVKVNNRGFATELLFTVKWR